MGVLKKEEVYVSEQNIRLDLRGYIDVREKNKHDNSV